MSMYMPVGSLASASLGLCPIRGLLEVSVDRLHSQASGGPGGIHGMLQWLSNFELTGPFVPNSVNPVGLQHHDHDGDEDHDDADADSS